MLSGSILKLVYWVVCNMVTVSWPCSYRNGIRYEFEDEVSFENLKNFMNSILA